MGQLIMNLLALLIFTKLVTPMDNKSDWSF